MENQDWKEIELFIEEELSQHGEWLIDRFIDAIEQGGNVASGQLIDSMNYDVKRNAQDGGTALSVSFNLYGRVAEAMASRRKRLARQNTGVWATANHKPKQVKWYNRNRYAGYGRLISRIAAGMSDMERARIKGILEKAKQNLSK